MLPVLINTHLVACSVVLEDDETFYMFHLCFTYWTSRLAATCRKVSVTAGKFFQTVNAVLFPLPEKQDTVSHPVKA